MCHGTIGFYLIKIQSQHDWNNGTLTIADGALIGNMCFYLIWSSKLVVGPQGTTTKSYIKKSYIIKAFVHDQDPIGNL